VQGLLSVKFGCSIVQQVGAAGERRDGDTMTALAHKDVEIHTFGTQVKLTYVFPFYFLYLYVLFCFLLPTGYGLDVRGVGVRVPVWSRIFSSSCRPDCPLGSTHPPIKWVPGTLSPGVKRRGRETDHSPPTSAEVKKMWIYISTPPYAFMA
jgi:hypothetical protein